MTQDDSSPRPFAHVISERARELAEGDPEGRSGWLTKSRNLNWLAIAGDLERHAKNNERAPVAYETLRKALVGDRNPTPALMAQVADFLGIDPYSFEEFALAEAQRAFDVRDPPIGVGYERAIANLRAWAEVAPGAQPAPTKQ